MARKVIIIGGVAGGASAAARLRRNDENAEIILLEKGNYISFANCGLPYYIGNTIKERSKLLVQTPKAMNDRFKIDVRVNSEAVKINPSDKTVVVKDHSSGREYTESYDKLIIATGAVPMVPNIEGIHDPENKVFTIWSIPDTDTIKKYVEVNHVQRAVIMGAGFVGMEMAENLHALGIDITVVEALPQVMNTLDFEMAQYLHKALNDDGIHLCLGEKIIGFAKQEKGTAVKLESGKVIETDMVIAAAGVRPNSAIAKDAGLKLGERGHIITDKYLMTSEKDIYAVGDVIEVEDFINHVRTAVPLAGPANKQGRIAADNVCGGSEVYTGTQGTSVAKIMEFTAASTGSNEKALKRMGKKPYVDYLAVYSHPQNHASYYPGGSEMHMKMIFDASTGKILGAQAVGKEGVDKRIDVLATVIRYGGVAEDLTHLELAYAPPYNTAKDPVNMLGYMAENLMKDKLEIIQWDEIPSLDAKEYQIVDVRTDAEYQAGAVPGCSHVPLDEIRDNLDKFDKEKTIVVYCKAGLRSYIAARILKQNGAEKVKSMTGGWTTYEMAHYKTK